MRITLAAIAAVFAGCSSSPEEPAPLRLATTTSVRDTGLLDFLLPRFEAETGVAVHVVAVGSGQALEIGRRGDADALVTHAPDAEEQFMAEGFGSLHRRVMSNDFVIVGPSADPAAIAEAQSAAEALARIAEVRAPFVSRGDGSGTHMKERALWQAAGVEAAGDWYIEAGGGMAEILRIADEFRAYTLSDRATFVTQHQRIELAILFERDPLLENAYSVILIHSERHPHVNREAARRFADFLLSPETQEAIGRFGVEHYGQALFHPASEAGAKDE